MLSTPDLHIYWGDLSQPFFLGTVFESTCRRVIGHCESVQAKASLGQKIKSRPESVFKPCVVHTRSPHLLRGFESTFFFLGTVFESTCRRIIGHCESVHPKASLGQKIKSRPESVFKPCVVHTRSPHLLRGFESTFFFLGAVFESTCRRVIGHCESVHPKASLGQKIKSRPESVFKPCVVHTRSPHLLRGFESTFFSLEPSLSLLADALSVIVNRCTPKLPWAKK